ncbi:MAG TPA: hypothetical protein EYO80_02035, partial [Candidatus Marinimicrobia bacterium]|nr:hypothetical protein [Candidatus Neomarinimicrobiota bacterium]
MRSQSFELKELPIKIIWAVVFLTIVGLIVLRSISQHHPGGVLQNPFSKQFLFLIPAIICMIGIIYIPRFTIHKYSYTVYAIGIIFVILPFFGSPHAGTYRWLNMGLPFGIQPSEFAKVFTIIALARYLSDHNLQMKHFTATIIPFLLVLVPTAIVMNQPDLGTAIVVMTPVLPMLYWSGARPFHLFLLLAPLLSMLTAFHNIAFTVWTIVLGMTIIIARPKRLLSL